MEETKEGAKTPHLLTTSRVLQLATRRFEWRCEKEGCGHVIPFSVEQIDAIPFLMVRHMLKDHSMTPTQVVGTAPTLASEVDDYCRRMGWRA